MLQTVARTEVAGGSRRAWLEIAVALYLENDYGIGDGLGEPIAQSGHTPEAGVAVDLLRASLVEPVDDTGVHGDARWSRTYQKTITCELIANLLRRSGRDQEIDALFLDAGLHYHYVLHRTALDDPPGALAHALEYVRNGYDVSRAARAFLDSGMTTEAFERIEGYRSDELALKLASLALLPRRSRRGRTP